MYHAVTRTEDSFVVAVKSESEERASAMDRFWSGKPCVGLCCGFLWGIGCSLAILYSIYLAGYRKAIKDSSNR